MLLLALAVTLLVAPVESKSQSGDPVSSGGHGAMVESSPLPVSTTAEYVVHVQAVASSSSVTAPADGSAAAPFPTIEAARDHLRILRTSGTHANHRVRVSIGPGVYPPLVLGPDDSGSPGHPVIYEADQSQSRQSGEPVVISGGIQVPKAAFQPWAGHPGVVKADLASLGVPIEYGSVLAGGDCGGNCSGFAKAALVFGNVSMVLARWPNVMNTTGRYAWEKVTIGGANGFSVTDPGVVPRMAMWAAETEPWLHSYAKYDWSDTWDRINISASATEVNVTIVDPTPSTARDVATAVGGGTSEVADGVWVIKISAPPGRWSAPTVVCNGTAHDRFRVLTVPAGGPMDPLNGHCKQYNVDTQNILQVSTDNGVTWVLAQSNSTSPVRGALACGNDPQKIGSETFGPFCTAMMTQSSCVAQTPRCVWQGGHCVDAPTPPPPPPFPPPPSPQHPFTVGQAKFYGANLLCELDAPNEFFIDEVRCTPDPLLSPLLSTL